jgi:hypothetical protein
MTFFRRISGALIPPGRNQPDRQAKTALGAILAVVLCISSASCAKVEQYETRKNVGSLLVVTRCTVRTPWLPDSVIDSKCTTALTNGEARVLQPSISSAAEDPQGRVVAATTASGPRVWFYDAKSGALIKEKDLPTGSSYPTWSPDGTAIATHAGILSYGLYVTDVADGIASVLVDTAYGGSGFAWSPSGTEIAYVLSASNPSGRGKAELWVWQRASKTKRLVSVKEFTSWSEMTVWPGWIGEEPHLCSDYFVTPDPDCARVTRPK